MGKHWYELLPKIGTLMVFETPVFKVTVIEVCMSMSNKPISYTYHFVFVVFLNDQNVDQKDTVCTLHIVRLSSFSFTKARSR
jgi:hypothetical protein